MQKWIFVTGGVLSGLGKGLVSASISKLLQSSGHDITPIKCDGYLNIDPGTMNPHEHGEVFVLEDGTEVDMDFGHYERFLEVNGKGEWNLTSGKIFQQVIEKERKGEYLGNTVQMVPHVTDQIKKTWREANEGSTDIKIIEVGGTVGDIENMLYLETIRQLISELPEENTFLIHTTLVPYLKTTGEQKTKPTQHSVKKLQEEGLSPDMIVGRSDKDLNPQVKEKISLFCDVEENEVISDPNMESVYQIPIKFEQQNVGKIISQNLNLEDFQIDLKQWRKRLKSLQKDSIAKVGICGKYTEMEDSYASIEEALKHASAELGGSIKIEYIETKNLDVSNLEKYDGIIIPGGFGKRGVEPKLQTIKYCRENQIPLLGLCYGMQLMVVEFSRNVLGWNATSEEFGEMDQKFVIKELPGQKNISKKGGTMRLGTYEADVSGQIKEIYGKETIEERHRHRYEVDPDMHQQLENNGLLITGLNKDNELAEFVELEEDQFFIGTQAHPEFKSSFESPNPLYKAFVGKMAE